MNIQDGIGKGFCSIERAYSMGVNDYFFSRRKNRPHATPKYGPVKYNFEVDYYIQTYCSPEKYFISEKNVKRRSRSNASF